MWCLGVTDFWSPRSPLFKHFSGFLDLNPSFYYFVAMDQNSSPRQFYFAPLSWLIFLTLFTGLSAPSLGTDSGGKENGKLFLPLSIVVNSESSWRESEILKFVSVAQDVFSRNCNVELELVSTLQMSDSTFEDLSCENDYRVIEALPNGIGRPVAIFTDSLDCYYSGGTGYANAAYWSRDHEFEHLTLTSLFIEHRAIETLKETPLALDIILAHELTHILTNAPHNEGFPQNLLANKASDRGTVLTEWQCEQIRKHPLVHN